MRFFSVAAAVLAILAAPIFGAPPQLKTIEKYEGEVKEGSFIITLKVQVVVLESFTLWPWSGRRYVSRIIVVDLKPVNPAILVSHLEAVSVGNVIKLLGD